MVEVLEGLVLLEQRPFRGGQTESFWEAEYAGGSWLYKKYRKPAPERRTSELWDLAAWAREQRDLLTWCALPQFVDVDDTGRAVGVLMREAPSAFRDPDALGHFFELQHLKRAGCDESATTAVLGRFLGVILKIHDQNWTLGDIGRKNVLIAPSQPDVPVHVVDCDSFFRNHDPGFNRVGEMMPPGFARQDRRTDLYKWTLLAEQYLTGDVTLEPTLGPFHEDARSRFSDWQLDLLDRWKAMRPPPQNQAAEDEAAQVLSDLMGECLLSGETRRILNCGMHRPTHDIPTPNPTEQLLVAPPEVAPPEVAPPEVAPPESVRQPPGVTAAAAPPQPPSEQKDPPSEGDAWAVGAGLVLILAFLGRWWADPLGGYLAARIGTLAWWQASVMIVILTIWLTLISAVPAALYEAWANRRNYGIAMFWILLVAHSLSLLYLAVRAS